MTGRYKKILVAVALKHEHDEYILAQALKLVDEKNDTLYIAHAVQPINTYNTSSAFYALADIENQITEEHKEELNKFAANHNIKEDHLYVIAGSTHEIISRLAKEIGADILVVGSHPLHGLGLFSGFASDSILKDAACDVLAVRLPD